MPKGSFASLPPEILDMITSYVFPAGHTSLIRTSRSVFEATKATLFRHGICRTRLLRYIGSLGLYYHSDHDPASRHVPSDVQNLEIQIIASQDNAYYNPNKRYHGQELREILHGIMQPVRRPVSCRVIFALGFFANFVEYELSSMQHLRKFEEVTLELYMEEPWSKSKLDDLTLLAPVKMHPAQRINKAIGLLEASLMSAKEVSKEPRFTIIVPKDLATTTLRFATEPLHSVKLELE